MLKYLKSNKRTLKDKYYYVLIVFIILSCISCKNSFHSECKPRYFVPKDTINVYIYDFEKKIIELPYEVLFDSLKHCLLALNDYNWEKYIDVINNNILDFHNPYVFVLFLDKDLKNMDTLKINDITGIQKYTITKDSSLLFHKVFFRKNNYFLEDTSFSCTTTGLSGTAKDVFGEKLFKYSNVKYNNSTIITLYKKSFSNFYLNQNIENILKERIIQFRNLK